MSTERVYDRRPLGLVLVLVPFRVPFWCWDVWLKTAHGMWVTMKHGPWAPMDVPTPARLFRVLEDHASTAMVNPPQVLQPL